MFEQLFTQVLASCREAVLLDGSRLIVDGDAVEANAALKSLRAELEVVDGAGSSGGSARIDADGAAGGRRARRSLSWPRRRSGPTPKRKASNATALSRTDPDAKLRDKPGHRPHLVHRAQVATDPKSRVIVAVHANRDGHEADSLPIIIDRARLVATPVSRSSRTPVRTDGIYASLEARGSPAYIPPQPNMRKSEHGHAARARCKTPVGSALRWTGSPTARARSLSSNATERTRPVSRDLEGSVQLLLAATAINLKRLMNRDPAAENAAGAAIHGNERPIAVDSETGHHHRAQQRSRCTCRSS